MKKLILNAAAFQKGEVLTRSQLKKVLGGTGSDDGSGGESGPCADGSWINSPDLGLCFNCCLAYHATQPPPLDPNWDAYLACDETCSG